MRKLKMQGRRTNFQREGVGEEGDNEDKKGSN